MKIEDRIKLMLGNQLVQLVAVGVQLEDAQKRIAELEAKLPPEPAT